MKKSVLFILVILCVTSFLWLFYGDTVLTGLGVLDLPEPPPPPSLGEEPEEIFNEYGEYVVYVPRTGAAASVEYAEPATVEERVANLESKVGILSADVARHPHEENRTLVQGERPDGSLLDADCRGRHIAAHCISVKQDCFALSLPGMDF